jgi:hypothetical protein
MGMKSSETRREGMKVSVREGMFDFAQRPTRSRATIRPEGVAIKPPMADWIRPNSIKRASCARGIVLVMKPGATSSSEENSAKVRSSALGKRFMNVLVGQRRFLKETR